MIWSRLALCLAGVLVLGAGCQPAPPQPAPLRIAAASDLRQALPVLIAAFRQTRNVEVDFTAGSSGQLAEQIRQGAPFDLFLAANQNFVAKLAQDGTVVAESVQPYTRGALALAVNPVFNHQIKTLEDLTNPAIKSIAIANPELAPYGIAAKQALVQLGLWDKVEARVVPAESVAQALQFVRSGSAEVGFVSRADSETKGLEILTVPTSSHDPIVQYLGIVARSTRKDDARAFAEFLNGKVGQAMLIDLGFLPKTTAAATPRPAAEVP